MDTVVDGGLLQTVRFLLKSKTEELQEVGETHAAVRFDESLNQMLKFCRAAAVAEQDGDVYDVVS